MWCARWERGVRMALEECRMKLRVVNPGQGAPMGIEERRRQSRSVYQAEQTFHAGQRNTGREAKSRE
jgi:hypothetical protein